MKKDYSHVQFTGDNKAEFFHFRQTAFEKWQSPDAVVS